MIISCHVRIISFWIKLSTHSCTEFLSGTANVPCAPVQVMIITDCIRNNGKTIARWSYNYHLPKFTCITRVTVYNVDGVFVVPIYIYIYTDCVFTLVCSLVEPRLPSVKVIKHVHLLNYSKSILCIFCKRNII